jgi:4-diphosphocytidyl-2-C-methyl-D-erythritol kinase
VADPSRRLAPVVRVAPAKLNLTLAVVGRRPDGFHALHSVVVPLALVDRLSLAIQPAAPTDSLHVTGLDCGPAGDNLVLRAIVATREAAAPLAGGPSALPPLAARLEKRVPVAAGLGGGSSNAAAAIDAALEAWEIDLPAAQRLGLAARVGSDVPLFLARGPAVVEGRGERVTPLRPPSGDPPGVLLVTPALPIPTGDVFALFAAAAAAAGGRGSGSTRLASEHLAQELGAGLAGVDLVKRAGVLASANDLAAATAALAPALVPFRRALMRRLGRPVGQSGSGPTLWALYPSPREAEAAAADLAVAVESGAIVAPGDRPPFVQATTIAPSEEVS